MRALYPQDQRRAGQTPINIQTPKPIWPAQRDNTSRTQDTRQLSSALHLHANQPSAKLRSRRMQRRGNNILFLTTLPGATVPVPAGAPSRCGSIVSPFEGAEPDALGGADAAAVGSNVRNGVGATRERWKRARNSLVGGPSGKGCCCCCCGSCPTARSTTGYGGGPGTLGERPALMACSA